MKKSFRLLCISLMLLVAMSTRNVAAESICDSPVSDYHLCSVSTNLDGKNEVTRNIICSLFGHKLNEGEYQITIVRSIYISKMVFVHDVTNM